MDVILTKLNSKSVVDNQYKEIHKHIEQKVDTLSTNVQKQDAVNVQYIICTTMAEDRYSWPD